VTLPAENSILTDFPVQHGSLCVSAATLEQGAPTNAVEVVLDRASELSLMLLDVRGAQQRLGELTGAAREVVRNALQRRAPMYEIVSALRSLSASEHAASFGVVVLRFSQPESRVEILNAGMPAVACVLPDGELSLHASLSAGIGERFGEVHPYELAPLSWGSSWLMLSDGLTGGRRSPDQLRALLHEFELPARASELSRLSAAKLAEIVAALDQRERPEAGRSLLVVNADPNRRFRSGIQA
jgi:hypothetical protein